MIVISIYIDINEFFVELFALIELDDGFEEILGSIQLVVDLFGHCLHRFLQALTGFLH